MRSLTVGFISLGLIGGSIAKTMRRIFPETAIIAYNRTRSVLEDAVAEGVVDIACDRVDERFAPCDYIFLCAPVETNVSFLPVLKTIMGPDAVLTDVGSTKCDIHRHIEKAGLSDRFIGGHPMTGSEKTGYSHATAYLLENAYYMLTPTKQVPGEKVDAYRDLVKGLGALPMVVDCETHDYATAAVSHLPHLIAASLVNLVKDSDTEDELLRTIAAGGFKDITRIAASSPVMWQQICSANRAQVQNALERYIASLEKIHTELVSEDDQAIYDLFDTAGEYRSSIATGPRGSIRPTYELYCDIIDESGAIATIATILATNGISIKNIGIVHNREYREGVLRIEFYKKKAVDDAAAHLQRHRYTIYRH